MQIIVNGDPLQVAAPFTAKDLVNKMGLTGRRIAMEVNRDILPRSHYDHHQFQDGDQVEIVNAIGGG